MISTLIRLFRPLYRAYNRRIAVRGNVHIGAKCIIGPHSYLRAPDKMEIGKHVHIGRNFFLACNGSIGDGVLISSYVSVVGRHDHDMKAVGSYISDAPWIYAPDARARDSRDSILVGDDVWIGFGAILLSGITVGRGAVIGAGSIVTKDVEPYEIVVGSPARTLGSRFNEKEAIAHETILRSSR